MFLLLTLTWILLGLFTFAFLIFSKVRAPYGRHSRQDWGKTIANHWGWFWMELPALIVFPLLTILGPTEKTNITWLLIGIWLLHYGYRVLIFPFQLKTQGKQMPLVIVGSALFFNLVNGVLNGYYLGYIADPGTALFAWNVLLGLLTFYAGRAINRKADRELIALREKQEGYQIPSGWLFEYISCPNHFGEIVEWIGFALIAWNLPALSFALWTFFNLVPRALNHHDWYQEYFEEYPKARKAVLPFLW